MKRKKSYREKHFWGVISTPPHGSGGVKPWNMIFEFQGEREKIGLWFYVFDNFRHFMIIFQFHLPATSFKTITQRRYCALNDHKTKTFPKSHRWVLWDSYFFRNHRKTDFRRSYAKIELGDTILANGARLQKIITERVYKIETYFLWLSSSFVMY